MQHHFDVDLAVRYGFPEAIILNHFEYWIELNEKNEKNFFDGYYWTFNSMKAMCEIFPYLSEKKIRNALKHLQDEGLIITGNYNKSSYDRTLWYAVTDKGKSIMPKGQMDYSKRANLYHIITQIITHLMTQIITIVGGEKTHLTISLPPKNSKLDLALPLLPKAYTTGFCTSRSGKRDIKRLD